MLGKLLYECYSAHYVLFLLYLLDVCIYVSMCIGAVHSPDLLDPGQVAGDRPLPPHGAE